MVRVRLWPVRVWPARGARLGGLVSVRAGAASIALRLVGAGVGLLVGVQLARYLGPSGLGIYGVTLAAAMMLSSAAQIGLPALATREIAVSRMRGDGAGVRRIVIDFALVTAGCGLILGLLLAGGGAMLGRVGIDSRLVWGALLVPSAALVALVGAQLRGFDLLLRGQAIDVVARPAMVAALLLALHLNGRASPASALAANVVASLLAIVAGTVWLRRALPGPPTAARIAGQWRGWGRAAVPLAIADLLRQFDGVYGVLMVGALSSAAETGIFRAAASIAIIAAIPNSVAHVVLAPTLARLHAAGDTARLQVVLTGGARTMLVLILVEMAVIAAIGERLIAMVFGDAFAAAAEPLLILLGAQAVSAFFGVGWVLLAMSSAERSLVRCLGVAALVGVAAGAALIPTWGSAGAAWAGVLGYTAAYTLAWLVVRGSHGLDCSALGLSPPGTRHTLP